ncbi:MAG: hypothetical protein KDC87_10685 [Planctomycetes bacterium]|nr:hypothetical protein [Planctomycetota bacterium]MCB9872393.1 hypothetical protein [Planctomycetota bacterium]
MDDDTFAWDRTWQVVAAQHGDDPLRFTGEHRLEGRSIRVELPLVVPPAAPDESVDTWLARLPHRLGLHWVILLQAGAASLGAFDDGEVLHTKSEKKYVVRGTGRAQPTHLKTRGKSRYGSRLRLQNAKRLLSEVNQRLTDWLAELGAPERVFCSCPVRLWADLRAADPPLPLAESLPRTKIPLDLPVPTTEVLLRTYRRLCHGRVVPLS